MDDEARTPAEVARSRVAALAEEFERREMARMDEAEDFFAETDHRPRFRLSLESGHVRVLGAILVVAVVAVVWWTDRGGTSSHDTPPPAVAVEEPTVAGEVVVHVGGEVAEPGIVTLPAGARVVDAVEAAGGAKDDSDLSSLNLARPVNDGEQILVGVEAAQADGSGEGAGSGTPDGLVSLNQASTEQLQSLPGVGPVTAEAIVRWRDENGGFAQVEDLLQVRGIGEARLAELRDLVTV